MEFSKTTTFITVLSHEYNILFKHNFEEIHCVAMKFLKLFYCMTYREPCDLIIIKTFLCMFQLAPVTISMN
jgi:hypothetical protein